MIRFGIHLGTIALIVLPLADGAALAEKRQSDRPTQAIGKPKPVADSAAVSPKQIQPWGTAPLSAEAEAGLKPKDSFKECPDCPEMVVVPKGTFMMGTPESEPERSKGEDPVHRVTIAKPFAVARFSITFDEWDACLADGGCRGRKLDDGGRGRGRLPAQGVKYSDAEAYLAWLSQKVGRTYRLPSESEREYFARAGTTTPFWFGKAIGPQNANYRYSMNYANGPTGPNSKGPVPVDSFAPNPFGLYQVHGNVYELTQDCFNKRYTEDTPTDGSPWLEGNCAERMIRGGDWDSWATVLRSGYRYSMLGEGGGYSFRVVRSLPAVK